MFLLILLAGGYFYLSTVNELYDEKVKFKLSHDQQEIKDYFENIKNSITTKVYKITEDKNIAHLIDLKNSNHQDFEVNQLLLYTDKFFDKSSSYLVTLYDDRGYPILKNGTQFDKKMRGFISHENNTTYFVGETKYPIENESLFVQEKCITHHNSKFQDGILGVCYTHEILDKGKIIGYAKVSYFFGAKDLNYLNQKLHYNVYFDAGKDKVITQNHHIPKDLEVMESLAYDGTIKLYANHIIDETFMKSQKNNLLIKFILLCTIALVLSLFISYLATNTLFIKPLKRLKASIEAIKNNQDFSETNLPKNDEFTLIIDEFNDLFKQLSDTALYNDAYIKSINDANLVSKTNLNGIITYANESFTTISGHTQEELLGKSHNIVRHPDMPKEAFKNLWETIQDGQVWRGIVKNKTKDGGYYWTDTVITPVKNKYGQIVEYLSIRRDITELIEQKQQLLDIVNFDSLTKLASRTRLKEDLKTLKNPSLALINIDDFAQMNDFYGHNFGDIVLKEFANRLVMLTQKLCQTESIYRQSGDEFVILCDTNNKEEFIHSISIILHELEENSFSIDGENVDLTVSCGISFEEFTSILLTADMALRISKNNKENFIIYNEKLSLNKQYEKNILWARKVKDAIANDKIIPFFQPIVNNQTKHYEKYEALVRLIANDGKIVSPYFFLDIAKKTKQYIQLTTIMLEKTFEAFSKREEEFSINITMEDIINKSIYQTILNLLLKYEGIGKRVVFEIVESESIDGNYEDVLAFVDKVKEHNCKIAIDDFGSGYSNFEYLLKLKADFIKIDGSLIKEIHDKPEAYTVVSVIVSFAKQMGIKTIAEFVEDEKTLQMLENLGIDYSQGYYFSPPLQTLPKDHYAKSEH
jgi:diguanylate cyclase (GGDEF)-like protein/PAS domain S-box-containing protein